MKKFLLTALTLAAVVAAGAKSKAPKDPVLMTVDGAPVTLSEFEYLYNKNNDQQIDRQSLDEYLEMFKVYKLKVAEARHQHVDTTAAFRKEFEGYRAELAAPYLRDTETENKLVDEAYEHMKEQRRIAHIMLPLDKRSQADSLQRVLTATPGIFYSIAQFYSVDPSLKQNGGDYGWISAGQFPYDFEEGVYNTPVGGVSEVITTDFGYHLVRVDEVRPNPGEIRASHILITGLSDESKARIDSIYNLLQQGADFAETARSLSNCPSSAQGGDLGFFGPGRMVPDFEAQAYALADGEMSAPFTTRFGWHIVKRTDTKGIPAKSDVEASIRKSFDRDGRTKRIIKAKADKLAAEYNAKINPDGRAAVLAAASADELAGNVSALYSVGDSVVTVAEFASALRQWPADADALSRLVDEGLDQTVLDYESHRLEAKYPEFRNIVGEYRDGMMLFEVSSANVWNVPTSDPEGLEAFFQADKQKYATWDEPRFKGYIIYATSDSLLQEVNTFLAQQQPAAAEVGARLKEAFPRNIKIERVVLPKGRNKVVDAVAFGGEAPDFSNEPRWKFYTSYAGRVVEQPEEAADARAAVSADYQQELEKRWVEQLRAKYPIVVNNKVLKKVKPLK